MKRLIASLLVSGILCATLLYINTESWAILVILAYMIGGSLYLWIANRPAPRTTTEAADTLEDGDARPRHHAPHAEAPARSAVAHGHPFFDEDKIEAEQARG